MQQHRTSRIKLARTKKGLTQDALAAEMGVTKSAVCGWEQGREYPHPTRLARLSRALAPHLDLNKLCAEFERAAA